MSDYWPAFLVDPTMETPHGILAFRTVLARNALLHVHSFHEFLYLASGSGRQRLGDRTCALACGDLHFLPANSWHIADGDGTDQSIVLNFYDTSFSRSIPADREALAVIRCLSERSRAGESGIPLTEAVRAKVATLLEELVEECKTHPASWQSAVKIRLHALLLLLQRETALGDVLRGQSLPQITDAHTARIEKVLAHIQEHLAERLPFAELSRMAGMGHTLFCEAFKACTGHTLVDYINRLRVDRACFLLTRDDRPLQIIAETCGFRSFSHFYGVFRSLTGRTPHRFRASAARPPALPAKRALTS